jgi:hypothetical protein
MSNDNTPIAHIDVALVAFNPLFGPNAAAGGMPFPFDKTPRLPLDSHFSFMLDERTVPRGTGKRPLVTLDGDRNLHVHGDVVLRFAFVNRAVWAPNFNEWRFGLLPIGMSYRLEGDPHGGRPAQLQSLPREDIRFGFVLTPTGMPNVPYIQIHNTWAQRPAAAANGKVAWKYYIFVQDEKGNIAAIDPDIENESDPA